MQKCTQWSLVPSYLTNFSALNLGGIMTWGKLVRLSRSTLPWALEPSMIQSFLLEFPFGSWLGQSRIRGSCPWKDLFLGHCPEVVYYGPDPILVGADFHSQFGDLFDYDKKSYVFLLQSITAPYALILTFALSSEWTRQDSLRELKAH